MSAIRIRLVARDLPGDQVGKHRDVFVGIQGRTADDIVDPVPAGSEQAEWEFDAKLVEIDNGFDWRGPFVHGTRGDRFLYLSWCSEQDGPLSMFGRSKLLLSFVGAEVVADVARGATLVGTVELRDDRRKLRMTSVKPPAIRWTAQ